MPTFLNPTLAWGLLLAGVPVLIHLINLLRQRRVPWAAMEFLLVSQQKNRSRVRLVELLLLLLRMVAVAAIVLVVAQPLLPEQLSRFLGGGRTHHVVLLDDSFSMSDRQGAGAAFDEALRVVERIGAQAASNPSIQIFSLVRFSRAGRSAGGTRPDLLEERVDSNFAVRLAEIVRDFRPTQLAVGPGAALEAIEPLLNSAADLERVVYVISDFRARQWDEPEEAVRVLDRLDKTHTRLHLIDCVDAVRPNLALAALRPGPGTRAAGVPFFMELAVHNYSSETARSVSVLLTEDGQPKPALVIDEIAPGQSETRRFGAYFETAGEHVLTAQLDEDTIAADNKRFGMVDLPSKISVLAIDGHPEMSHARFVAAALAPGGAVRTGIDVRMESPAFLNNHPLDEFRAVYLLDVERLDQAAVEALDAYVNNGGGLGIFLGDRCRAAFYNERLYQDGKGWFPAPLLAKTQLLVDRLERGADLEITPHPIFRVFEGERNSFLNGVSIDWYWSVTKGWKPDPRSSTAVIASLRNGAPLAIERTIGKGRVVAILTTAAPVWNNWGRNPSFVVAMLEMQSYLAPSTPDKGMHVVGSPIEIRIDPGDYRPQVRLISPAAAAPGESARLQNGAAPGEQTQTTEGSALVNDAVADRDGTLVAAFPEVLASGLYEVQLTTAEDKPETSHLAFNVDPEEGDLARVSPAELADKLTGVRYEYRRAAEFQVAATQAAGTNVSRWLLYAVLVVLVAEQGVAYAASYHPSAKDSAPFKGGPGGGPSALRPPSSALSSGGGRAYPDSARSPATLSPPFKAGVGGGSATEALP